ESRQSRQLPPGLLLSRVSVSAADTSATGRGVKRNNESAADASRSSAARMYSPGRNEPVSFSITPRAYGPRKPPRLPTELIIPVDAAAAEPDMRRDGNAQKAVCDALLPTANAMKHRIVNPR